MAYFAKGPLSRARAAFYLDCDSTLDVGDLIHFLKGLVLAAVQIDLKYRETIPEILRQMKASVNTSEENPMVKRRRSTKQKLGKNGLYPGEDRLVRNWWSANVPEQRDDEHIVARKQIDDHVTLLRTRETQLQIILLLEILSLEPAIARNADCATLLPTLPGKLVEPSAAADNATPATQPTKRKRKHDLPLLLDVHSDRLCIWQSTSLDELLPLQHSISRDKGGSEVRPSDRGSSGELLRDFCVDIIVPL